jgi:hypothetical protein
MSQDDPAEEASSLPPRPNPGPEPWPESGWPSAWWLMLGLPIIALARWRFRRARMISKILDTSVSQPNEDHESDLPAERLVRLTERLREALVVRFGANWAALTTEEIERTLPSKEIAIPVDSIAKLFRAADRVKFGHQEVEEGYLAEAETLALEVTRALFEGAISNQNGK